LHKDEAEKHRGNVVITFKNLLILSHKILFNTWVRNTQQQILTSSVVSLAVRLEYIEREICNSDIP